MTSDLLDAVLTAHGGWHRWQRFTRMNATIVTGGTLWGLKGQPQDPEPRLMSVALQRQWASVHPFGAPDQRTDFTAERVAIDKLDGSLVSESICPRETFDGHTLETPWNPLQRAYFNGYALWTYLTTPFFMALPGFEVHEIAPVDDQGERWSGLQVEFPDHAAGHSRRQEFYFGSDFLLRRHDYRVDVAGGFAARQYVYDPVEVGGIILPTRRRAYRLDNDGRLLPDELMVAIDISDIHLSC